MGWAITLLTVTLDYKNSTQTLLGKKYFKKYVWIFQVHQLITVLTMSDIRPLPEVQQLRDTRKWGTMSQKSVVLLHSYGTTSWQEVLPMAPTSVGNIYAVLP